MRTMSWQTSSRRRSMTSSELLRWFWLQSVYGYFGLLTQRLIFHLSGNMPRKQLPWMVALNDKEASMNWQTSTRDFLELFAADYATEEETAAETAGLLSCPTTLKNPHGCAVLRLLPIKNIWQRQDQRKTLSHLPLVLYKFPVVVVEAVTGQVDLATLRLWVNWTFSGVALPPARTAWKQPLAVRQTTVAADQMQAAVEII